ncbi:hypothetical protein L9F63_007373, partial [Diploptera punctata]
PLPMKLRALPQSFWQQPNHTNCLSPGAIYPILPPLSSLGAAKDDVENVAAGMRSTASPEEGRREVSVANTDLLFSLFRGIEDEQPKVTVVRRGRPKKPPSTVLTRVLRDEDPCLVSTVTESILPLIPDRTGSGTHGTRLTQGQQVLAMVSLKDGDKCVSLPSLNVEHNYSQILSELVIKLKINVAIRPGRSRQLYPRQPFSYSRSHSTNPHPRIKNKVGIKLLSKKQ